MAHRTGEKVGWIGGWLGGFLWVVILAVLFLVQRKVPQGFVGLALFFAAAIIIFVGAPWRHPNTPYWKLMTPVYIALFGSIAWMFWSSGGPESLGLNGWNAFLVLPLLIPLWTVGRRRWIDANS